MIGVVVVFEGVEPVWVSEPEPPGVVVPPRGVVPAVGLPPPPPPPVPPVPPVLPVPAAPPVVRQSGAVIVLVSRVTEPLRASTRPSTVAPVFRLTDASAMIVPMNSVEVPSVAEESTCQNTWHDGPLMKRTLLPEAVIRVDPALKMKTASGLPWVFSVSVPVSLIEVDAS
jgi:hypothetical protein